MSKLIYIKPEGFVETANYIFVGEAGGSEEEKLGRTFVGKCGQYLRKVLSEEFMLYESDFYLTNVVKVRPEGNRKPTKEEIESWATWLDTELFYRRSGSPVIALGTTAHYALDYLDIEHHHIYHPSYVLRFNKKEQWLKDLKKIIK